MKKNKNKHIENIFSKVINQENKDYLVNKNFYYSKLIFKINEFAKITHINKNDIINWYKKTGIIVNENYILNEDMVIDLCKKYNFRLVEQKKITALNIYDSFKLNIEIDKLSKRPPIVTIMGHIDHGKTTLLDYIRKSNIAKKEFGKITQHIGAYQITYKNEKITFIDTPGHEAFTEMRARGAEVTDIIIIVISAAEGIKEQTIECFDHAKEANIPIIIAINKIDLSNADIEKTKSELEKYGFTNKNCDIIPISALSGKNVDNLLENILLISEDKNYKTSYLNKAFGVVIESFFSKKNGPAATLIVKQGILLNSDYLLVGNLWCKIRFMENENGEKLNIVEPSQPIKIYGLTSLLNLGDKFIASNNGEIIKKISAERIKYYKELKNHHTSKKFTIDDLKNFYKKNDTKKIKIILISDSLGSSNALNFAIDKLNNNSEIKIDIIHKGIGKIKKTDILLAKSSNAIIFTFNIKFNNEIKSFISDNKIIIKGYNVIYHLIEELEELITLSKKPVFELKLIGKAIIQKIFIFSKIGKIAGCYVNEGLIKNNSDIKIIRNNKIFYEGKISSLKRFNKDIKEVKKGFECGTTIEDFNDFNENDIIEVYEQTKI